MDGFQKSGMAKTSDSSVSAIAEVGCSAPPRHSYRVECDNRLRVWTCDFSCYHLARMLSGDPRGHEVAR